jgi:methionyl aminopeptidase
MAIAIEPMFIIGTGDTWVDPLDQWTVRSKNGKLTSHDEHTIIITEKGSKILTIE